jgi:hypothetical protein
MIQEDHELSHFILSLILCVGSVDYVTFEIILVLWSSVGFLIELPISGNLFAIIFIYLPSNFIDLCK